MLDLLLVAGLVGAIAAAAWLAHRDAEWQWAREQLRWALPSGVGPDYVVAYVDREYPDATPRRRRLLILAGCHLLTWGRW